MKQLDNPNPRNLNRDTAPLQQKIWKTSPCDILFKSWICFCTNFEFNGFNTHQLFQNWLLMVHLLSADLGSGVPVPLPKCLKWWVVGFSLVVSMLKVGVHFAVQPSNFVNLQVRREKIKEYPNQIAMGVTSLTCSLPCIASKTLCEHLPMRRLNSPRSLWRPFGTWRHNPRWSPDIQLASSQHS